MVNLKREPVSYRPFRVDPLLSEGLLGVERSGGELERKVSNALFAIAERSAQEERARQARDTVRQVRQDVFEGRPRSEVLPATPASAPPPRARGARFAPDVAAAIDQAAQKHGVDGNTLTRIAQLESGGNPRAKNPRSSAGGLFQFIDSTARDYGLADRFDASQSADAAARLLRDNAATLRRTLGREPTSGELYLAHQQGAAGAAKLLANPDRPASEIVGVDAVNKNGGRPGMTAGQFARLWVDRAEQGYVLPRGAPAGPMPGDGPRVAMSGGTWRPSGKDTVLGRLYDEEGVKLYLQSMEQEIVGTLQQAYDLHKGDPQKLREVYASLKQEQREKHVFDDIVPEWEISFDSQANRFLRQAGNDFQQRQDDENRLAFLNRVSDLETTRAQAVATFDPESADATDAIQRTQKAIEAHYDDAVTKGILTPEAAEKAKRISRNESALGFYTRQAETMAGDDVAGMRETMRADFAAGKLDGLDADGWAKLDARLATMERTKRTEDKQADQAIEKRGAAFIDRVEAGWPVDQAELGRFLLDANTAPNGRAIVQRTLETLESAEIIQASPVEDARAYVESMRKALGPTPSDAEIARLETAEEIMEKREKAIRVDPLGYAERSGTVSLSDIDTSSDDALAASLEKRRADAQRVSLLYDVPVGIYRPDEIKRLKESIKSPDNAAFTRAMAQLDYQAQDAGVADVARTFGEPAADMLQDWQARLRYMTADEVATWRKERSDPRWQDRVKPLLAAGEKKAREVPFEDIVADLDDNIFWDAAGPIDPDTKRMLMNDFVTLAADRYATTEDAGTAREQAIERLRRVWGVSSVYSDGAGGRLMLYPPEEYYPTVGGSKDWLAEQLGEYAAERGVEQSNLSLISDGKTKAAADGGGQPGYLLSAIDPETGLEELVTDEAGRPLRYFFDPDAALVKAKARAEAARETQNDPWLTFGEGTSIGPFYPPWRPATAADMADRARRIREINGNASAARAERRARKTAVRRALRGREKE